MELNRTEYEAKLNIDRLLKMLEKKGYKGRFYAPEVRPGALWEVLKIYLDQNERLSNDLFPLDVQTITHCKHMDGPYICSTFKLDQTKYGLQPVQMKIEHFDDDGNIYQSHQIKIYCEEKEIPHKDIANKLVSVDFAVKKSQKLKI